MDLEEQIIAIREEFDQIDTDHDGFITLDEAMAWGMTQREGVRDTFERHIQQDRSGNGRVSFEEFLRYKGITDDDE
ncbi:EF-hand domain-containing protein [Nocardia sp. NPDC059091]|uniref:EF-hand domain-containing protein n=1 Tax=unclassified Nocardia TaxID=2637762 RepID=UPI0036CD2E99